MPNYQVVRSSQNSTSVVRFCHSTWRRFKKYATINTQRGLYQYTRVPFGISSSPSIFQCIVDNLIQGLLGTVGCQDDILVTGKEDAEHIANLDAVLQRLSTAALCLNKDKCVFMASEATYLGYRID